MLERGRDRERAVADAVDDRLTRAVVFAYHNVGVRCLSVLLAHGVDVALVVTHDDDPSENIWFEQRGEARARARHRRWPRRTIRTRPTFVARVADARARLPVLLLLPPHAAAGAAGAPRRAARFNMHGSLLPKYRGRVPVNWAVLHGERETGATLHDMVEKPDAGRHRRPDARCRSCPTTRARRRVRQGDRRRGDGARPRAAGAARRHGAAHRRRTSPQGSYFGGRKPEDGRIDWTQRRARDPQPGARGRAALSRRVHRCSAAERCACCARACIAGRARRAAGSPARCALRRRRAVRRRMRATAAALAHPSIASLRRRAAGQPLTSDATLRPRAGRTPLG